MPAFVLTGHADAIAAVAVSADGHWLATGSYDGTARLWDLSAANPAETGRVLTGRATGITDVVFSPDGRRLVTTSFWGGGAVEIDPFAADPAVSAIFLGAAGEAVSDLAFTPNGRWLVADDYETKTIRVWAMDLAELVALACRTAGRNLTAEEWRQFVGAGVPYQQTCPNVPPGTGVRPAPPARRRAASRPRLIGLRPPRAIHRRSQRHRPRSRGTGHERAPAARSRRGGGGARGADPPLAAAARLAGRGPGGAAVARRHPRGGAGLGRSGHEESYLEHRGRRVEDAERLAGHPRLGLNTLERAYLDACVAQREGALARQRRLRAAVVAASLAVAVVSSALAIWAFGERDRAEEQARVARSRQLAAEADARLVDQLDWSLLLSVEAVGPAETSEAKRMLLAGLTADPYLVRFLPGQQGFVNGLAFSPDGTLLASGGCGGLDVADNCTRAEVWVRTPQPAGRGAARWAATTERCIASPSALMARRWPRAVAGDHRLQTDVVPRSGFGTSRREDRAGTRSSATRVPPVACHWCRVWRSARTARRSPQAAST